MNKILKVSAALTLAALASSSVFAQSQSGAVDQERATVGAGIGAVSEYAGSDKTRAVPLIFAEKEFGNGFFASTYRGLGYATKIDDFKFSGALSFRPGRDENKRTFFSGSDALKGMGKIENSFTANFGISGEVLGLPIYAKSNLALTNRENGNSFVFGLTPLRSINSTDIIELDVHLTYGDSKFNQTYFGVSAQQSKNSGYKAFTAGAGLSKGTIGASWTHLFDKNWSVRTAVGFDEILGDSKNSPLVKKRRSANLMATVNYTY